MINTVGVTDQSWLDKAGHPHSVDARIEERYTRIDHNHMQMVVTVDDPKAFMRPWTITTQLQFNPDTDLLEYVCNENEKSRQHFVQPKDTSEIRVDPVVLAKYTGKYEVMTPRGKSQATVTVDGDQLMIEVLGMGSGRMIPQSPTMFQFRGAVIEFVANETGEVTHLIAHAVEGDFKGPRIR